MCGIVGVTGDKPVANILLTGLKRLEYRGYDSSGIAVSNSGLHIYKAKGKISELEKELQGKELTGVAGIAHTRWATHGQPNVHNAHPHTDCNGKIAIVHNGIIENFAALKTRLKKTGHTFTSDTDSEVLAHLISEHYDGSLEDSVRKVLQLVEGAYGLAVMHADEPDKIVAARLGSPLVVGLGDDCNYLASDVAAILGETKKVLYLKDGDVAVLTPSGVETTSIDNVPLSREISEISWDLDQIQKGGYPHFMLKEIFEQPTTIKNAFRGRVLPELGDMRLDGLRMSDAELRGIKRIVFLACGTSWHAALLGEYLIEEHAGIPVEVEYASEFRYRSPVIEPGTVCFVISQSGETIDTLEAMREARRRGAKVIGLTNVVGSTIARESDAGIYIHAGPEIGVASTKAFTSQVTILIMLTVMLARRRNMSLDRGQKIISELKMIPEKIEMILGQSDKILEIAKAYKDVSNFLYLGRGYNFPIALEGALKLKEISYIHAEGYPAAEMKHGPIALIDPEMPVLVISTSDESYQKIKGNVQEVKAREGKIISIVSKGENEISSMSDHVIEIPESLNMLTPLLAVIPLQLLSYHIALLRGENVDQPRNLAKSVTVE